MPKSIQAIGPALIVATSLVTPTRAQQAQPPVADDTGLLEEVLVTANKRVERLHDVPASITAVSADTIAKMQIVNPQDFQQLAPTLNFQAADEARLFNFSIRGIGTEAFAVGVEPSVATIIDGVVYTRPGAAFDGLGDIERVEVLNGPQGTLQGKNASAGAISILTKRPNRDEFEGRAELTGAEANEHRANLMLTGPINDTLAYRVFGYYRSNDGEVTNVATGDTVNDVESYGLRGKLEWQPSDSINLLLAADYSERTADCCAEPIRVAAASGNVTQVFTGAEVGPNSKYVNLNTQQDGSQDNRGASLEGNFDIGRLTLTSLTAYREYRDRAIRDRDGTNAPFTGVTPQQLFASTVPGISAADALTRLDALLVNPLSFSIRNGVVGESNSLEMNDTFSQEFRLTSPAEGMFDYLVGLFYYDSFVERDLTIAGVRSNIAGNVAFPTPTTVTVLRPTAYVLADMVTKVTTTNKALFANFNLRPVDRLTLTVGARYLEEDLRWQHQKVTGPNGDHIGSTAGATMPGANVGTPAFDFVREFSDDELIGKTSAKFDFTDDLMVYASYARGYKGQAVDADIFLSQAGFNASPVAPEKSESWEGGLKSRFFDRRLEFSLTYYDTTFTGYQTTSSGTDGSGAPVLRSAGELFTKGYEGEIVLRAFDGFTLASNFLFADNEFGDLFVSPTLNVRGGVPLNAPDTKWGVMADYEFAIGTWNVNLNGNYTWTSETLFTNLADANNPNSVWIRPDYGLANASIALSPASERFMVTVFVKNLTDEQYVAGLRRISGSVGGAGAVAQAIPRDYERYFGVSLGIDF